MNKSPEEYFQEQNFSSTVPSGASPGTFTATEMAFMEKYMGLDTAPTLRSIGIAAPEAVAVATDTARQGMESREETLDTLLRHENQLLMVGFSLGNQEFVVPTLAVQEVVKSSAPARLPMAPPFVAGIVNLRGKVTPLIRLRDLLGVPAKKDSEHKFTIICRRQGLQLGLLIDSVRNMYRVAQEDIDWSIEAHVGSNVDFISGLLKQHDKLIGIVSVDRIVEKVVQQ